MRLTGVDEGPPHVAMIVGNDVTADTRVRKMAVGLAESGYRVTVLGLSTTGRRTEGWLGQARIIRLPVIFALRNQNRRKSNLGAFTPGYRSKEDYIAARRRRKVAERELAATAGRWLRDCEERQDRTAPWLRLQRRRAMRVLIKSRRAALKSQRKVVDLRESLYRRRLGQSGAGPRAPLASLKRSLATVAPGGGWRRLLPEIDDYELAFGPVLDELQPDIIHAHDVHMIGIAERAAARAYTKGRRVRWIYDAHEYVPGLPRYTPRILGAYADLEREYIRSADRVITVSEPIADELQRSFDLPRRPTVVMNIPIVRKDRGQDGPSVRAAAGLDPRVPLLVYSGGINATRGVRTLVEALAFLPDVHVALVTKAASAYVRSLEQEAEKAGTRARLHLVPFVAPDEVPAYLSSATVGVSTLTHYGNHEVALPNKYFEYMHARLPIVVSDVKAMADLTRELGIGEVFVAEDPRSLADAVRRVLADVPAYTRPYREQPEIFDRFSWRREQEKLLDVYRELHAVAARFESRSSEVVSLDEINHRPPERISLAIGPSNMAGQAWAWAKALEAAHPGILTEVFTITKASPLLFPTDVRIPGSSWKALEWQLTQLRHVLETFTHVLLEAGLGIFGTLNGGHFAGDLATLEAHGIRVGLIFHGSEVRDPREHRALEPHSPFGDAASELTVRQQEHVDALLPRVREFAGCKFATTMDLLDYVPDAQWLPVVVDSQVWRPGPPPLQRRRPVVVHAPSNTTLKGSATVDALAEELHGRGLIEYRRLRNMPVDEMPIALRDADIVLDQFALGDYGVVACQGMATGRVVVGHVSKRVRDRLPEALPIIQANAGELRDVLCQILEDRDAAREAARRGIAYVENYHSGRYSVQQLHTFLGLESEQ